MNRPHVTSAFVKSTYTGGAINDCLEIAHTAGGGRAIRDSKRRDGGTQCCSPATWAAFLTAVKTDAFEG